MSISFQVGPHRIRFAGKSDVGLHRSQNEDSILMPTEMALGAIADGMGGHAAGDVASKIAVETIEGFYRSTAQSGPRTWPFRPPLLDIERMRMETAVKLANSRIYETASADSGKKGMGTTIDAIYFTQGRLYIGHVGDSRVYRVRKGQIQMMTEDHSLRNDWLRMKGLSGEDVVNFPFTNVVVRALGLAEQVNVDVVIDEYKYDDIFLLCSDGLNDMIDDATILKVINKYERLDSCSSKLIAAANDAGGKDNITALLVRIERVS
ncbi:MAG: Stp1/IreP family PP2C-type Ser/Thr phosphatase [Myxococcales bacterium]|nr:Stp1/IreP family PP2C-type Ser/Thr phosphatase [Myxococcales bacterium]MCB9750345.1 Stp1/IreP family PP2C-type Ser/Thr phosphatase [Myxococcales bacterium]